MTPRVGVFWVDVMFLLSVSGQSEEFLSYLAGRTKPPGLARGTKEGWVWGSLGCPRHLKALQQRARC